MYCYFVWKCGYKILHEILLCVGFEVEDIYIYFLPVSASTAVSTAANLGSGMAHSAETDLEDYIWGRTKEQDYLERYDFH